MTFPAVQTKTTTSKNSSSPFTLNMPTGLAAGDLMVMVLDRFGSGQTFTWPAGWTQVFSIDDGRTTSTFAVAWKIAVGGEGSTISVSSSTTATRVIAAGAYRIDFAAASAGIEAATATSTTQGNPPSLTPSWGALDTLWLAVMASGDSLSLDGYPANYSSDQQSVTAAPTLAMATRQLNATSDNPPFYSTSGGGISTGYAAATIAIKPEAAASIVPFLRPHGPNSMRHLRR